jgi:hypothetical protein
MKRFALVATMLALAVPALAAETKAAVLSDSQLDAVAAGCNTPSTMALPNVNTNVNFSPIIVNQTAVAITQQNGTVNASAKSHGKGNAKAIGQLKQNANTTAMNFLNINYHPKF